MGIYFNPVGSKFEEAVNSDIYVDKTGLLNYTNSVLHTMQKYLCISRPRRFGKSMAANMLSAYYSRGCDEKTLFSQFEIARSDDFTEHLNRYNTISVNMQEFLSRSKSIYELIDRFKRLWIILMIQILLNACRIYMHRKSRHLLLLLMSGTVFSESTRKIKMPRKSILIFCGIC